ncbi:FtsX-like permease family protein [Natronoglycomyces albus]|uniref:FtsX-like permease family protein n=1 Tax=Natronoglycomyces albus TaxID=2811108 RepID=A0A895XQ36_9ACTN|nr:FtsX-like permease family protein [Natronoglycomyces albus]QSB05235.1 FtsX-like permease family protein [Natronoglycomyces albus]
MLQIAMQTVRGRMRTFVSSLLVLTMAVTVVTASGVLVETGMRGQVTPERFAATDLVVAGDQRMAPPHGDGDSTLLTERVQLDSSLASDIAAIDGVENVVVDRAVTVTVGDGDNAETAVGQSWNSAELWPLAMTDGRAPQTEAEIAVDQRITSATGWSVGDTVRVGTSEGGLDLTVVGIANASDRPADRLQAVFFTDERLASLTLNPDRADAIGVFLTDGADLDETANNIAAILPDRATIFSGPDRSRPEALAQFGLDAELIELGGGFGGTALILSIFVVMATLGMTIMQRSRETAMMRAIGATTRQVRRMLVAEAAILAVLAGILGALPGLLLGQIMFGVLQTVGVIRPDTVLRWSAYPVLIATGASIVAAVTAAWFGSRRSARIHPTAAVAEATLEPRRIGLLRTLLGFVLIIGGLGLSFLAGRLPGEDGAAASVGVMLLLLCGIAAVGPILARIPAYLGGAIVGRLDVAGFLAKAHLRTRTRRLASAATPLALASALSVVMIGVQSTESAATDQQDRDRFQADFVIEAPAGISGDLLRRIRDVPGSEAVVAFQPTTAGVMRTETFDEPYFQMGAAVAVSADGIGDVLDLDVSDGSLEAVAGTVVGISRELARTTGSGVSDSLDVWWGDGTKDSVEVGAIYERSLGFGDVVVDIDHVSAFLTEPAATQVLIAGEVDTEFVASIPGAQSLDRAAYEARKEAAAVDTEQPVNLMFVGLLVAFMVAAAVNSLVLATGERRGDFRLLRLVGATGTQIRRMMRWEAVVIALWGTFMGLLIAAATLVPFSHGLTGSFEPTLPWWLLPVVVIGSVAITVVAVLLPTRFALRRPVF